MIFTAKDRSAIESVAKVLEQKAEQLGAESLARMFTLHPGSKIYFQFDDYSAAGAKVKTHGIKVVGAITKAAHHLDDLHGHLEALAEKHGKVLLVDPQNFPKLCQCIEVTLASHLTTFSPATHCAVDKLLTVICQELSSRYR
ncbi:hemoglobin subunit alpha-like [Scyliorhinus canicula]|uniref:hemoglobin subunit alpha-like n=1 Tax=Scyliorhinus canicula TaxID=7830 RepID=UPI0018F29ACD|nr:hemoglobin subunit alpha-like [Scyliorhinus canicula]